MGIARIARNNKNIIILIALVIFLGLTTTIYQCITIQDDQNTVEIPVVEIELNRTIPPPPPPPIPVLFHCGWRDDSASWGFLNENMNLVIPFSGDQHIGWYPFTSLADMAASDQFREFRQSDQDAVTSLFLRGSQMAHSLPYTDTITISLSQPHVYQFEYEESETQYSLYKIGRAMFETSWIPYEWDVKINNYLDELWVPSHFAADVFAKAGVTIPITVIGENFDDQAFKSVFSTAERRSQRRLLFPECGPKDVIFFFVGKFENRKGVDLLIEAYLDEIQFKETPACLYLRTTIPEEVTKWTLDPARTRGIRIYDQRVLTTQELINAYKCADVFVLPTHGEGWGRPIMEAMAAGLPVIVPYWSGLTEFVSKDYALTIDVVELEEAFPGQNGFVGGEKYTKIHQWAKVDKVELMAKIRWCIKHKRDLPMIGHKAREAMYGGYTRSHLAEQIRSRLAEINKIVVERREELLKQSEILREFRSDKQLRMKLRDLENKLVIVRDDVVGQLKKGYNINIKGGGEGDQGDNKGTIERSEAVAIFKSFLKGDSKNEQEKEKKGKVKNKDKDEVL